MEKMKGDVWDRQSRWDEYHGGWLEVLNCLDLGWKYSGLIDHAYVFADHSLTMSNYDGLWGCFVLSRTYWKEADLDAFDDPGVRIHRLPKVWPYWGENDVGEPIALTITGDSPFARKLGRAMLRSGTSAFDLAHVHESCKEVIIENRGRSVRFEFYEGWDDDDEDDDLAA